MTEKKRMHDSDCQAPVITTLGPPKLPTPLNSGYFAEDADRIPLPIDSSLAQDFETPQIILFEPAGPRRLLYFDPGKVKCAIVTCGGLCPGLNDVIRAIVLEAHHIYGVSAVLGIRYGLEGFIPSYRHGVSELTPSSVRHIHEFGGTVLGSSRGPQPPEEILDALERMNVGVLFIIGGDGSMKAASAIAQEVHARNLRMSIIGIPKTIDNDISFVPQSFGFETAVDKASEIIRCAHVEAEGVNYGVGIVKVMGRESGFIAAQASLAIREVNFVLVPETAFTLEGEGGLLPALENRLDSRRHAVVVVAEGAGQHLLKATGKRDPSGNPVLGDIIGLLHEEITRYFRARNKPLTIKHIDPSYIIRSVPPNANDRVYCGFLGQYAVHAAMAGKTDMVVAKIMDRYVHLPLSLVTSSRRRLNTRSAFWRAVMESTGQSDLKGMYPDD
jgi:6-phosphofructokinase 1